MEEAENIWKFSETDPAFSASYFTGLKPSGNFPEIF
jgi:hypothetical protein